VPDFFDVLCRTARKTVATGYYSTFAESYLKQSAMPSRSLSKSIDERAHVPLIAEIKVASPTMRARRAHVDVATIARHMEAGGAAGISVVTEPHFFKGSPRSLETVRSCVSLPVLMKDFIVNTCQIDAARDAGVSAVLLIQALFDRGYATSRVEEMIELAHTNGLQALLEAHTVAEFESAISSDADLIGINNRDLGTLDVDLTTTKKILAAVSPDERVIVSESGVKTPADVRFLRQCGADALLVGSALMEADDVYREVQRLVMAA
jgi:indole-3-glycerol phosphate synthase